MPGLSAPVWAAAQWISGKALESAFGVANTVARMGAGGRIEELMLNELKKWIAVDEEHLRGALAVNPVRIHVFQVELTQHTKVEWTPTLTPALSL